MAEIKKFVNDYFVCRSIKPNGKIIRNWFLIKTISKNRGGIFLGKNRYILTPKELIGKRIRLKIEVLK